MIDGLIGCKIIGGGKDGVDCGTDLADECYIDVEDELRQARFRIYFEVVEDGKLCAEVVPWVPRPPERRRNDEPKETFTRV